MRTQTRPGQLAVADNGGLGVDLEPDVAAAVPRVDALAAGDLGHVELHGARVEEVGVNLEGDAGSGRHGRRLHALGGGGVASDVLRVDVDDALVGLVVCRRADELPVSSTGNGRECVW